MVDDATLEVLRLLEVDELVDFGIFHIIDLQLNQQALLYEVEVLQIQMVETRRFEVLLLRFDDDIDVETETELTDEVVVVEDDVIIATFLEDAEPQDNERIDDCSAEVVQVIQTVLGDDEDDELVDDLLLDFADLVRNDEIEYIFRVFALLDNALLLEVDD